MAELSCEARKTQTVAISTGWDGRPIGVPLNALRLSRLKVEGTRGVQTVDKGQPTHTKKTVVCEPGPGAIAFERIFLEPTSWLDSPREKLTMAPLVEV
jgi:hypothetical protein